MMKRIGRMAVLVVLLGAVVVGCGQGAVDELPAAMSPLPEVSPPFEISPAPEASPQNEASPEGEASPAASPAADS